MDTMPIFTRVNENLISLRNSMNTIVLGWLRKWPKVWLSVCYVSCVVGLLFLALSSSFICLIEKWIWWKMLLYTIVSLLIILLVVWLTKPSDSSISREREASTQSISRTTSIVSVLVVTLVYTHFVEEKVDVKPDAYIFVSYAAFSIMSLFLSTLSHYGFEVELFYFFTGILTLQFMKIKWWLVIVGLVIMFILDYLRSTLDTPLTSESRVLKDPNHVPNSQVTSSLNGSQENEDKIGLLTAGASSSQGAPANEELFSACIKALQKENDRVADHVFQSIRANADLVDKNLVVDLLPLEDLHESAQLMMKAGLEAKCLEEYTSWRREFLDIILSLFPSPDLKMEDIDNGEKNEGWVQTLTIAVRILFPNEITLCGRVFGSDYFPYSALAEVCKKSATRLIVSSYAVATWSHYKPDTLQQLLQELDIMFQLLPGKSSSLIVDQLNKVRFILDNFRYFKNTLRNDTAADGIHPLTRQVMNYIGDEFKKMDDSVLGRCFEEYATAAKQGKLSPSPLVEGTIELLESNLEATSKSYKTPSLGYVFIMINRTFIAREIERFGLEHIIGHDWVQGNQQKIKQNLQLYLDSSWSQILNLLNDEHFQEAESKDDLRDLMEENLNSFNQHFDGICNDKSMWFVFDDKLRDQIIKSIKNMLLPAYTNFIDRFYESLPYTSYSVIKPEPRVVEDRLNKLFLERADESDAGREPKKDV